MKSRESIRLFFSVLPLFLAACQGVDPAGKMQSTTETREVTQSINAFTLDSFKKAAQRDENIVLSPYSIATAFTMVWGGAAGNSALELAKTLHLTGEEQAVHDGFGALQESLNLEEKDPPYDLVIANRLWGQSGLQFNTAYLSLLNDSYGADFGEVNFKENFEDAHLEINRWVEKITIDKIKDLFPEGSLTAETRLVLANAIYLKSQWADPFTEHNTVNESFYLTSGDVIQTPMMKQGMHIRYAKAMGASYGELALKGDRLTMFFLVPDDATLLSEIAQGLTGENLANLQTAAHSEYRQVTLPRFKVEKDFDLKPLMQNLGTTEIFTDNANLSRITSEVKLAVSKALHKAFINVDEKGVEAAAATGIGFEPTSLPVPAGEFTVDRPFVYGIQDLASGTILFIGKVVRPEAS